MGVCFIWAFGLTWLLLKGIDRAFPLRVSLEQEEQGLNIAEHGAKTDLYDLFEVMDAQAQTQDLSLRVPVEPFTEVGHISTRYNTVMAALEQKEQQIQDYLRQVEKVTAAAAAVRADRYYPEQLATVVPRVDGLGQLARVFNHMVETIRVREQELAQARDQLEAVLNAVPGPISWLNVMGIYLGVNVHMANTFSLAPEAIVGRPVGSLSPNPDYQNFINQFLLQQQTSTSQEVLIQAPDQPRHYLIAAQKYQQGEAAVVVGIDVTERHEAQEALQIAEENYRSIFENALEGIFQSSPDGQYLKINPAMARIYGYDSPEQMMETVTDIGQQVYVNSEDHQEFQRQLATTDQVKDLEYQVYRKDGTVIWVQEDTRAVRNQQGQLLHFAGIIHDITDRKQREAELRRQLAELRIEIDQNKRQQEVSTISQSDYFQNLQQEITQIDLDEFWS